MDHNKAFRGLLMCAWVVAAASQAQNKVDRLTEVFAWKQLTFDIGGNVLIRDRFGDLDSDDNGVRNKRQSEGVFFQNDEPEEERDSRSYQRPSQNQGRGQSPRQEQPNLVQSIPTQQQKGSRPKTPGRGQQGQTRPSQQHGDHSNFLISPEPAPTVDENGRFFVQYNNVPMGAERVGDRLFITVPRRRYGIPSTLNYIVLSRNLNTRSPALRPYPDFRQSRSLLSVYRTRADSCGRLWMVDTGMLEIPGNMQQIQPPAIVIFDLSTNRQIRRYEFKSSDLPSNITARGLASITVDVVGGDCAGAHAYVPDLVTNGLIVYSLRENDSWRLSHNYFNFNPNAGNLNVAGQSFQWNDGIFSITLGPAARDGCRLAYFHPMVSTSEFSVSTCVLKNRTASDASDFWERFNVVGDRGERSQSTMHALHPRTRVVFFADIARDAVSCWSSDAPLASTSIAIVAQDSRRLVYPSDLHVTNDEVWVMANTMPRFIYSRLNVDDYNFFVYRASVNDLVEGTVCAEGLQLTAADRDSVAFNES